MPHLFVDRPRQLNLLNAKKYFRANLTWETLNTAVYLAGGGFFVVGSFFFFPKLEALQDTGCLLFFLGSLLYLVVTGHDMAEVCWRNKASIDTAQHIGEVVAAISYLGGTVLFIVGSVFFSSLLNWSMLGASAFIVGSMGFAVGAGINVLQIVEVRSPVILQLENLTAVSFLVGSVLFTVASIPYLWDFEYPETVKILYGFLAWQYLGASALFVFGGVFNYGRVYLLSRQTPVAQV